MKRTEKIIRGLSLILTTFYRVGWRRSLAAIFVYKFNESLSNFRMQSLSSVKRNDESFYALLVYPMTSFAPYTLETCFEQNPFRLFGRQAWELRQH